jgi:site-specific DNA-methyltransferase (adenine-specific)
MTTWPDSYIPEGFTPYFQEDAGLIFNCDCRDILPHLPKVDLVLTDPPYGFNRFRGDEPEKFLQIIKEAFDVMPLKNGHWAFVFTGTGMLKNVLNSINLEFQRLLWMYKPSDCTFPYRGWLLKSEAICLFSKGTPLALKERKPYQHDVYIHTTVGQEGVNGHPTVKPIKIVKDLASRIDGIILDPFLGSGTTAVAAKELGRRYIGIEIEEKYCEISAKRLKQCNPLPFHQEPKAEKKQRGLI